MVLRICYTYVLGLWFKVGMAPKEVSNGLSLVKLSASCSCSVVGLNKGDAARTTISEVILFANKLALLIVTVCGASCEQFADESDPLCICAACP